jgi:hypothetical protein
LAEQLGRPVTPNDHSKICMFCERDVRVRKFKCSHCQNVAHKQCIQGNCNDFPQGDDAWKCPECVRDADSLKHTNDCAECNEWSQLKQDMDAVIDTLAVMEENAHIEPEFTTGDDYVGRRVKKEFDGIFYEGKITAHKKCIWTIQYSDGATEEHHWSNLKLLLLHHDKKASVAWGEEDDHIGKTVSKYFGRDLFEGKVISREELEEPLYYIEFDDDDEEDCVWGEFELLPINPFSRMARARLKTIHDAGEKLKAHKCRFANQDAYKELITSHILSSKNLGLCYVLVDYWAKLPARLKDTGCCENLGKGISVLGTMFVYRNPNVAEREDISKKNPGFDWAPFGTAPDDAESPGSPDLVEFINLVDQNASQTAYHTACSMKAAFEQFKAGRPWFKDKERCFYVQSDGASKIDSFISQYPFFSFVIYKQTNTPLSGNFKDPATVYDLPEVAAWCVSEAGEGKDQIDSNASINKQGLNRRRNEGFDQEDASQYAQQLRDLELVGNTVIHKQVLNSKFLPRKYENVDDIRGKNLIVIDQKSETIIIYELLDIERSLVSLEGGGLVKGYGDGERISLKEFNEKYRSRDPKLGVKILQKDMKTSNSKPFKSKSEKEREAARKKEKKNALAKKKEEAKKMTMMRMDCCDQRLTFVCKKCGVRLKSLRALARHEAKLPTCVDKKLKAQKRRQSLDVKAQVNVVEEENIIKHQEFKSNLNTATVSLSPLFGISSIGITLEVCDHNLVVADVINNGLAFYSGLIHRGFILMEVNGESPMIGDVDCIDTVALSWRSSTKKKVTLKFLRPDPQLPYHGCHRKLFRKEHRFKPEPRQLDYFHKCLKKNPFASSQELHVAMKIEFGNELRDDLTPMYFTKKYISNLRKEEKKKAKKESSKKSDQLRGLKDGVKDECDIVEAKEESGFDSDPELIESSDEEDEEEEETLVVTIDDDDDDDEL